MESAVPAPITAPVTVTAVSVPVLTIAVMVVDRVVRDAPAFNVLVLHRWTLNWDEDDEDLAGGLYRRGAGS